MATGTAADSSRRVLGWTRADFEGEDQALRQDGWMLHAVDTYIEAGTLRFNGIWRRATEASDFHFGWTLSDAKNLREEYRAQGYRLHHIDTWVQGGAVLCNLLWRKPRVPRDSQLDWKRTDIDKESVVRRAEGWRVVALDTTSRGQATTWHVAWEQGADDHDFVLGWTWDDFNEEVKRRRTDGWALWRVDSYQIAGELRCNGVFRRGIDGHNWVLGWGWDDFLAEDDNYRADGWALDTVDTFIGGDGGVQFNATWVQHVPPVPLVGDCIYDGWLEDTGHVPESAVGYLSNGCTAVLIDGEHILTAAHCMVNEGRSDNGYYTDLWFYPTFRAGVASPPRFRVDRAVVGSHGETGGVYFTSDWAIGHLATPAAGLPVVEPGTSPATYRRATVLHYTRDDTLFSPKRNPPPYADEYSGLAGAAIPWGNSWWQDGMRSAGVVSRDPTLDYSRVVAASGRGGSSGSPHLVRDHDGSWHVVGVTHGGACDVVEGPWAGRFVHAPRFAAGVAIATSPWGGSRTGVYALDIARGHAVVRGRTGPGIDDEFAYWSVAAPVGPTIIRLAARPQEGSGLPALQALSSGGAITEWRAVSIPWKPPSWTSQPIPVPSSGRFVDLDPTGVPEGAVTVAVQGGMDGAVMVRPAFGTGLQRAGANGWGVVGTAGPMTGWSRVTALRHHGDGAVQVWALSTTGTVRTWIRHGTGGWQEGPPQPSPALMSGERVVDIDATWDHRQRGLQVALTSRGRVFVRVTATPEAAGTWGGWMALSGQVDPGVPVNRSGVRLVSVTASRWRETVGVAPGSDIVPVIVATDSWGNVYQATQRSQGGAPVGWTSWMPFHGRRVAPMQTTAD